LESKVARELNGINETLSRIITEAALTTGTDRVSVLNQINNTNSTVLKRIADIKEMMRKKGQSTNMEKMVEEVENNWKEGCLIASKTLSANRKAS
jgi:hypothetical protein